MERQKLAYDAPVTQVIILATNKGILATSAPELNNPYSGGGEDW